ncbi:copper resistance protein B [Psychrobacter sp. JCM 18900]|uniref:copper resistance protein B n=1 Tax=Psychrobacter sp. JCM 18900 TaxID=1298608 RepID=UPI0004AE2468|nr:copper resistance protein B [Psychrobacter sp. JCM 18900]
MKIKSTSRRRWYGTDSNRIRLRTEGSAQTKDNKEIDSLSSLAYWKPLSIFWNGEAGVAYDTENDNAALMAGIVAPRRILSKRMREPTYIPMVNFVLIWAQSTNGV